MKLKIFLTVTIVNLFLISENTKACGWYEPEWDARPMLFRVFLPEMLKMKPFLYTTQSRYYSMLPDPQSNDRDQNIKEWQESLSSKVDRTDIYSILYETSPTPILDSYKNVGLSDWAKDNSFIAELVKYKKNKEVLEYLLFAKQAEQTEDLDSSDYDYESWGGSNASKYSYDQVTKRNLLELAKKKFKIVNSSFLKDRYAFQVIRLGWQTGDYENSVKTFKSHFGSANRNNLMSGWSAMFCAMSLDQLNKKAEANRYYIQSFDNCDEKKLRCAQLYNISEKAPDWFTSKEKSIDGVIRAIQYPARSLDQLEEIYKDDPYSEYMPFLVMREVSKVEDWLLSSTYWRGVNGYYKCKNKEDRDTTDDWYGIKNKQTDLKYVSLLKNFILQIINNTDNRKKLDYYNIVAAHLSILDGNNKEAREFLTNISSTANNAIQIQKEIEQTWLSIKMEDVTSSQFQTQYLKQLKKIKQILKSDEGIGELGYDNSNSNIFSTLNIALTEEFYKSGDIVSMCLLSNTTYDIEKDYFSIDTENYPLSYYSRLRIYDLYASPSDMDKLIALIQKTNKTDFEKFLCNQPFNKLDAYRDLKGTIAFRNLDLKTAYEAFSSMDQSYWNENYAYSEYLSGDPFTPDPKYIPIGINNTYNFTKTKFIKDLLDLETRANSKNIIESGNALLKLGDAFYNTSYFGNFWMMMSYGWSSADYFDTNQTDRCFPEWMKNYMTLDVAYDYYLKAYTMSKNKETKAYACIMLINCMPDNQGKNKLLAAKYAKEYSTLYKSKTNFDKVNECLSYKAYL